MNQDIFGPESLDYCEHPSCAEPRDEDGVYCHRHAGQLDSAIIVGACLAVFALWLAASYFAYVLNPGR